MQVMGTTSDGASINRRFIRLHNHKNQLIHKVPNPYAVDGRDFFFFSDPPHLIKTTRNCWFSKSRTLWVCLATCVHVFLPARTFSNFL